MFKSCFGSWILIFGLSFLFVGCGSGVNTVSVNGTVAYKGELLKGGNLNFYNTKGEPLSAAIINADGSFVATDLPKGEAKVTVKTGGVAAMAKMAPIPPSGTETTPSAAGDGGVAVPEKYHKVETTDLKINVTSGNQKVELKLE